MNRKHYTAEEIKARKNRAHKRDYSSPSPRFNQAGKLPVAHRQTKSQSSGTHITKTINPTNQSELDYDDLLREWGADGNGKMDEE